MNRQKVVLTHIDDGVGHIVINRPESFNAFNTELISSLLVVLDEWKNTSEVQVVIFSGAGGKAFAAGADLKELQKISSLDVMHKYELAKLCNAVADYIKPTVAAVNGIAFGGGFELALACDIRVVQENTRFAFPELKLGIIPGAGGTQRLRDICGLSHALHYVLTRAEINADRAYELGITATPPVADAVEYAYLIARQLMKNSQIAQKLARDAIKQGNGGTGHLIEQLSQAVAFSTSDSDRGITSFLEKTKPEFSQSPIREECNDA